MPESIKKVPLLPPTVVVDSSIKSTGKRKRDAEEIVDKQKMVNDICDDGVAHPAVDKNKFNTMKQENGEENKEPKPSSSKQSADPTTKKPDYKVDVTKDFIMKHDYMVNMKARYRRTKLVFMDNLPPNIKENDVLEFFKDDGKIVKVTFYNISISSCGDVKFETHEAAEKALKRNGEVLIDRPVRLVATDDKSIFDFYTPKPEQKYLFMGNLSLSVEENDIIQFFKDVGEIVSLRLMNEDYPFEGAKSVAHVEFASSTIAYKALRRSGRMLCGRHVELVLATEKNVWYACTSSSSKPPRGPGWGPSFPSHCNTCKKDLGL